MNNNIQHNTHLQEIIRFGIVGGCATAIHYGIYLLLNQWLNANISYTVGYAIGFIFNFFMSNYFTFKTKPTVKRGIGFTISNITSYLLQIVLLNMFIFMGMNKTYAPIPVWMIAIPINFLMVRFFLKR